MVKFGRKFFFDNKHSKKRKIITIVVIACIAVGLIIFFTTTRFFKTKPSAKPKETIVVREELKLEINSPLPEKTSYFEKLENFDIDKIKVTYPENLPLEDNYDNCSEEEIITITSLMISGDPIEDGTDPFACVVKTASAIGKYDINVNFNNKDYIVLLNVEDTTAPQVVLKEVQITEGESYSINDFIQSCEDNGKGECEFDYYYENYENNELNYGTHTTPGTYDIVIFAFDDSKNISLPQNTKLTILPKPEVKTYTVTFNSNGGSTVDNQIVVENEKAVEPAVPTKEGYTFNGWYLGNSKYNFNDVVTSDITLTAKWTSKQSKPTTCSYGNLDYDKNAYPVVTTFISKNNCAVSKSDFNSYTYANKIIVIQNSEGSNLQKWIDSTAYQGLKADLKPFAVLNTSGKGVVGYTLQGTITQTVNGTTTEVARYYLDQNGKRIFKLNTINLPES